jgi:hypothetical protein
MKTKLLILALLPFTTGCVSMLHAYADHVDSRDPCQLQTTSPRTGARLKPEGWSTANMPEWCGAAAPRQVITNPQGRVIGYVRR